MTGHRINPSCERRLLAIFALASLSRCIAVLLQWPLVRRLLCHPEPSQSWRFTIICRTVQGNGLLPSSLSHFLRQCPLGSKKACFCPEMLSHGASSTWHPNPLLMALNSLSAWIGMENWPPPCYSCTDLVILKILWPIFCEQSKIPLHITEADRK